MFQASVRILSEAASDSVLIEGRVLAQLWSSVHILHFVKIFVNGKNI